MTSLVGQISLSRVEPLMMHEQPELRSFMDQGEASSLFPPTQLDQISARAQSRKAS